MTTHRPDPRGGDGADELDIDVEPVDLDAPAAGLEPDAPGPDDPVVDTGVDQGAAHAAGDAAEQAAEQVAGELDELQQMAAERDQFKELAQRVQADFENYRRRVSTQGEADIDRATSRLAEALLPVLDATEAAYVRHPDEIGPLLSQMLVELGRLGLAQIAIAGQPFDPNLAEAVAHEPGDGGEPLVSEVLRSGYTWKGRTLRPAMVRTKD